MLYLEDLSVNNQGRWIISWWWHCWEKTHPPLITGSSQRDFSQWRSNLWRFEKVIGCPNTLQRKEWYLHICGNHACGYLYMYWVLVNISPLLHGIGHRHRQHMSIQFLVVHFPRWGQNLRLAVHVGNMTLLADSESGYYTPILEGTHSHVSC